jgi:ribosomal protein S18 acetylase RimI-like enzyme
VRASKTGYDEFMAALPDSHAEPDQHVAPRLIELRNLDADRLTPLLDEEIGVWRAELDWDFRASADLVRRFVHMQALNGFALVINSAAGPRVIGYSYYICEEGKGLIGDLYVMREHRTTLIQTRQLEHALLGAVLDALWRTPGVKRVEAQPMMLGSPLVSLVGLPAPSVASASHSSPQSTPWSSFDRAGHAQRSSKPELQGVYPRRFLEAPLVPSLRLPAKPPAGATITRWTEHMHDQTARLIAAAYQGHIDALINDQYRSPSGARRFLTNIVQYPGCGTFFGPASYAAINIATRQLRGVSLASLVAGDCGHITQICVAKSEQGTGLGYELMRQSLVALAEHGCRTASLTVTASNESAIRLYQRMGFSERREFAAYVWDSRQS